MSLSGLRLHWPTMIVTIVSCFLLGVGVVFVMEHRSVSPIPEVIKRQVTFPIFLPTKGVTINAASYKFEPSQKVLSFTGRLADGKVVTFAEQPTPDPFTDIPNYYSQFLQTLFEYQSFDSLNGTVYLTHPKGAGQAAVMSTKGTLSFVRVSSDEPEATWQQIFNNLQLYAP